MPTLLKQKHALSDAEVQLNFLSDNDAVGIADFGSRLAEEGLYPLRPRKIDILQVNLGKMCNQVCKHCHVDAGPDRKEIMTRNTMHQCLHALANSAVQQVDLTGGAPELNPDFKWFVHEISAMGKEIIVRCNLTIILANPKYHDLPEFYKKHKVNVVSSLPYFTSRRTDAQRGDGVFEKSIRALQMLNEVGYGVDPDLKLDLVYNPSGAILPPDQDALEREFKRKLKAAHDITFNRLFAITNLPVSRFLDFLIATDQYQRYMSELAAAFNPRAAQEVMCRNTLSVSWDGYLYDCDFNQMLDMKAEIARPHIGDFDEAELAARVIKVNNHCYGCTAGAGSSCGGTVV
ncbi:MAG: radical SAM/Cys-rich domain protein [Cyclobacteriaceae bacterium]|nr:radical SAM/Cys-rich domain protein [Cyclobacteriaceae bacterium]